MRFSFDECEIINNLIEETKEISILSQGEMIKKVNSIKKNTEDPELIDICKSTISKITIMSEEKFNYFISNLPVETLSNY